MRRTLSVCCCVVLACAVATAGCADESPGVEVGGAGTTSIHTEGDVPTTSVAAPPSSSTASPTSAAPGVAPDPGTTTAPTTPAVPLGDPAVTLVELGEFSQPVQVTWRPTDGTVYVVEQDGRVVIMSDGQSGAVALDMTDLTDAEGERGLLGLAVSPDGALAYVNYTNNDGHTRVDEYAVTADATFDPATRREVLGFDQPYPNHNGGGLVFGPDNMLYIGTGDGGSGDDPDRRSLDLSEWLGKMLRIDPRPNGDSTYTVPSDNPFVDVDGARPEIWSIGLRNPWRFAFDSATGDLWIADVGQNVWEEVDVAWAADGGGRGANFGWSAFEGSHRFNEDQSPDGVTPPIFEYQHGDAGCSISGGVLYRGAAIPALVGWYVYADYCSGQVHALQIADRTVVKQLLLGTTDRVAAISEGPGGELYVVAGSIWSVRPA